MHLINNPLRIAFVQVSFQIHAHEVIFVVNGLLFCFEALLATLDLVQLFSCHCPFEYAHKLVVVADNRICFYSQL